MSIKIDGLPDLPAELHQPSFPNALLVRQSQCTVAFKASGLLLVIGYFFTMMKLNPLLPIKWLLTHVH